MSNNIQDQNLLSDSRTDDELNDADALGHMQNGHGQNGPVRRRASRAGTRSVSTLSAVQLERKRANDREAQRAIRQRTKENTERLEKRVTDLEHELASVGAGPGTATAALHERIRQQDAEIQMLRMRLDQAALAMGVENGAALEDHSARVADQHPNGGNMPLLSQQPQIGQAQLATNMLNHGAELSRSGSTYGYRPTTQWQQAAGYGAHPGSKRDSTPSNAGDHSPENINGWSGDRNRASEQQQHQQGPPQPVEYTHMMNGQPPQMNMRTSNQNIPFQPPHDSHAYPLAQHASQGLAAYSPSHGNNHQYMSHQAPGSHPPQPQHSQQPPQQQHPGHAQQSPHVSQLPPPHVGKSEYYGGFPQG